VFLGPKEGAKWKCLNWNGANWCYAVSSGVGAVRIVRSQLSKEEKEKLGMAFGIRNWEAEEPIKFRAPEKLVIIANSQTQSRGSDERVRLVA